MRQANSTSSDIYLPENCPSGAIFAFNQYKLGFSFLNYVTVYKYQVKQNV